MKSTFKISVFIFLFYISTKLFAQTTITVSVVDLNESLLIGANILVEGTSTGTTTDEQGKFTLHLSKS